MKRILFLVTILISTVVFIGCNRSAPISTYQPTPTVTATPNNTNSNWNSSANTYQTSYPATVRDWVYYYDVDIYGYPYYEEGHPKHRKGSRRWYPPGHPNFDLSYMSSESPVLKVKKNLGDLPKYRFSYSSKTLEKVSNTTSSSITSTKITYENDPLVKRPTFSTSVSTSLTPDKKTTSPYPKKTTTTYGSSDTSYGSTYSSSSNRKSSTSYGSSSYPSSSSYSTSSSSSSQSSTTYRTPSYSSSSSSSSSRSRRKK